MSDDQPFTDAELEAACDAAESALPQLAGWPDPAYMAAALRAVLPLHAARVRAEVADLDAAVAAGEASDGYHTHNELYEYRMLYNAHAAHGWHAAGIPVVKSWRHHDGEPCFGGGWFIVTAALPTGQVSNHYAAEYWDLFDIPATDLPPEWDGHTPADAADRLRAAIARAHRTTPGDDHA